MAQQHPGESLPLLGRGAAHPVLAMRVPEIGLKEEALVIGGGALGEGEGDLHRLPRMLPGPGGAAQRRAQETLHELRIVGHRLLAGEVDHAQGGNSELVRIDHVDLDARAADGVRLVVEEDGVDVDLPLDEDARIEAHGLETDVLHGESRARQQRVELGRHDSRLEADGAAPEVGGRAYPGADPRHEALIAPLAEEGDRAERQTLGVLPEGLSRRPGGEGDIALEQQLDVLVGARGVADGDGEPLLLEVAVGVGDVGRDEGEVGLRAEARHEGDLPGPAVASAGARRRGQGKRRQRGHARDRCSGHGG